MTADVIRRAFDPFFTTKPTGRGTGLGLSMVYGFVKQSLGHIKLYSELGEGTTVKLYFPPSQAEETEAFAPAVPEMARGGHEKVLVVEDDELVRSHVSNQLEILGYRVTAASNAAEALDILAGDDAFDLLFTDIIMPGGMNGRELASRALQRYPNLKVLYTSGYTENAIVHQGRLDPGAQLLAKPYRREKLAAKLREVLDSQ